MSAVMAEAGGELIARRQAIPRDERARSRALVVQLAPQHWPKLQSRFRGPERSAEIALARLDLAGLDEAVSARDCSTTARSVLPGCSLFRERSRDLLLRHS